MDRTISLSNGALFIGIERAEIPLDHLCGFAARRNPKRGFLFVSRILGRHIPARPSSMRRSHLLLADKLDDDLPGPVLMVGMAETAIGLGQGVFEAYIERTGRSDVAFLATTRYRTHGTILTEFQEPHSHASHHLLYWPTRPALAQQISAARTLVMIDDECSTGVTLNNLKTALGKAIGAFARIETVVLTDWSAGMAPQPLNPPAHSLLRGMYRWEPNAAATTDTDTVPPAMRPNGENPFAFWKDAPRHGRGRPGTEPKISGWLDWIQQWRKTPSLVLGSGEFVHEPFLVAKMLEEQGCDIWFQATSRSPIQIGGDIGSVLSFPDNYGEGIPNYLYNPACHPYRQIIAGFEPGANFDPVFFAAMAQTGAEIHVTAMDLNECVLCPQEKSFHDTTANPDRSG